TGIWQSELRLSEQVVDFPRFAPDLIRITVKPNVRCSNEVKLVPRNDEDRPPIAAGLQVDGIRRRARKWSHDEVTAFCSANQLRTLDGRSLDHEVDPWPGSIDHYAGVDDLSVKSDAGNLSVVNGKTRHTRLRENLCAEFLRRPHICFYKSLGKLDLGVVIKRRPHQPIRIQSRPSLECLRTR